MNHWTPFAVLAIGAVSFVGVTIVDAEGHEHHAPGGLSVPNGTIVTAGSGVSTAATTITTLHLPQPQPIENQVADDWYSQRPAVTPTFLQRAAWPRFPNILA
jgi:hypothetical protein